MNAPKPRPLTPARVVALALVALLAGGLLYLRFEPDSGPVSVPDGAKAGDLVLERCEYATEDGAYAADCGTLVVPETRGDPQSRLIALPVTRIRARSADPAEPIFRLEGGPGRTNMEFANASRFAGRRDVVLVGYRGVDGSVRLDCPEVESAVARSTDFLSDRSWRSYAEAYRACGGRLTGEGVDLTGYGLVDQADDLEAARKALGYERIDLLSESAGTRTALIYAWRHPGRLHRSVMIGANPPGHFLWDAKTTDEQLGRYAALCSQDDTCAGRTDDLAASLRRAAADPPDRWLSLPIHGGTARAGSLFGLTETTSDAAPLSGPMTLDAWLSADEGDASGLWFLSAAAELFYPKAFVFGQYAAAARLDADAARAYFASGEQAPASMGYAATAFAWGGGRLADAWPAARGEDAYDRMRPSDAETLLISGELDLATPPQPVRDELLPYLPNGRQVVLPGFGHTASFWADQPRAGTRLVTAFLDTGRVDRSLYRPQPVDFTPSMTQTAIAKIVAGAMAAVAALALLTLLWMARRVRTRGGFGRKAGATLRSVSPAVLGLGGWFGGALIVLVTMPGVPLDHELLASLSVGAPVGLGLYLAWVRRDWSAATRSVGLAGAAGGALIGAWLGFHAVEGLVAVLTAIVGAAVGGNLAVLALDVAWDRQARDRYAAAGRATTLEARPSTG